MHFITREYLLNEVKNLSVLFFMLPVSVVPLVYTGFVFICSWLQQPWGSRVSVGSWCWCKCSRQRWSNSAPQCIFIWSPGYSCIANQVQHSSKCHWQMGLYTIAWSCTKGTDSALCIISKLYVEYDLFYFAEMLCMGLYWTLYLSESYVFLH